jgi:hypothetical protein
MEEISYIEYLKMLKEQRAAKTKIAPTAVLTSTTTIAPRTTSTATTTIAPTTTSTTTTTIAPTTTLIATRQTRLHTTNPAMATNKIIPKSSKAKLHLIMKSNAPTIYVSPSSALKKKSPLSLNTKSLITTTTTKKAFKTNTRNKLVGFRLLIDTNSNNSLFNKTLKIEPKMNSVIMKDSFLENGNKVI